MTFLNGVRAALSNKPTEFMGILQLIKQVVWPEIEPPKRALPEPDKPRSVVSLAPRVPPALREERARLVFAVDATASRSAAWEAAKQLTDILFEAIPGKLDVALAVHGGGRVHTFTAFTDDAGRLRDMAMGIRCRSGDTRLIDILARAVRQKPKCRRLYRRLFRGKPTRSGIGCRTAQGTRHARDLSARRQRQDGHAGFPEACGVDRRRGVAVRSLVAWAPARTARRRRGNRKVI